MLKAVSKSKMFHVRVIVKKAQLWVIETGAMIHFTLLVLSLR